MDKNKLVVIFYFAGVLFIIASFVMLTNAYEVGFNDGYALCTYEIEKPRELFNISWNFTI